MSMFSTVQQEEHHIRTAFGVSRISVNIRSERKVYQEILQGNGAGPISWAATNTSMVSIQRKKAFVVKCISIISKVSVKLIGFVFVDVTDLGEGNLRPTNDLFEEIEE